jgi:heme/copper-type cytochrome/quinol oxidase subunit 1
MPRLSCWFIRASLVYLSAGFTLGALMLANKGIPFDPQLWRFMTVHMELLLAGWLIQIALGTAFWILPRFTHGPPRGNEALSWLAFVLINLGIGLVIAETLLFVQGPTLLGRLAECGGVLAFLLGSWQRVRPIMAH